MAKPTIVTRAGKGSALTFEEGDNNLTNLRDATYTYIADTGTNQVVDLNGSITFSGGTGITTSTSAGTVTVNLEESGVIAGSYTTADIFVDAQGRITAASDGSLNSNEIQAERIPGSTFSTVQHMQDVFHSTGVTSSFDLIQDDGDGTITVLAGDGLIRATDSDTATLFFTDWPAESGVRVDLTDNALNYIYVEYNGGSPRALATTIQTTDYNTNIFLGTVYRVGTTLHITNASVITVSDHAARMVRRAIDVAPYAHVSGGLIAEQAGRTFSISESKFWHGLKKVTIPAIDTLATDTYVLVYRDGVGGWTTVSGQTAINNLNYDDGTGTLATLSNPSYGVHWVFRTVDDETVIVLGQGNYTLSDAQDAGIPGSLPPWFQGHARLFGRIIIGKGDTTFQSIGSSFEKVFGGSAATDHLDLLNIGVNTHDQIDAVIASLGTAAQSDASDFIGNVVEDVTPQLAGPLDGQGNKVENVELDNYKETIFSLGTSDTPSINVDNGNVQTVTISSGLTLPAFTNPEVGQSVTLIVNGTGTAAGAAGYLFSGGAVDLTTKSIVSIFYDGTNYFTSISTDYQ